jgi:hypothetical protein
MAKTKRKAATNTPATEKKGGARRATPRTEKNSNSTALARREDAGPIERVKEFSRKLARKVTHRRGGKMATKEGGKGNNALGHIAAGIVGGAAGAAAGGLMVKAGLSPLMSAAIVTGAGGVGAYALDGYAKTASMGAGASGAGQLALTLMAKKRNAGDAPQARENPQQQEERRRNQIASHDVYDAMAQARHEIGPPPGARGEWHESRRAPAYTEPPPPPPPGN